MLHAVDETDKRHRSAKAWLESALNGNDRVGFCWQVLIGFMRISTLSRVFSAPLSVDRAERLVEAWLAHPATRVIEPDAGHVSRVSGLLRHADQAGNLVNDAHIAALALQVHGTVVSFDTDFGKFPGVRWRTPDQLLHAQ